MANDPKVGPDPNKVQPSEPASNELNSGPGEKVGYRCPPRHSRFKPGVSGNPDGRFKVHPTADDILLAEADRVIKVQENGRRTKMTGEQLIFARLTVAATKGGFKEIRDLLTVMDRFERKYFWGNVGWNKVSHEEFWKREYRLLAVEFGARSVKAKQSR